MIRCTHCGKNTWRGDLPIEYIKLNGCLVCRVKNKYSKKSSQRYSRSVTQMKGRYDQDDDELIRKMCEDNKNRKMRSIIDRYSDRRNVKVGYNFLT